MEINQNNTVMDATSSNFLSTSMSSCPFFSQEEMHNNLSPSNYLDIINNHSTSGFMYIDDSVGQEHVKAPLVSGIPNQYFFHSSADLLSDYSRIGFSSSEGNTFMPRSSYSISETHDSNGTVASRSYSRLDEQLNCRLVPNQNMQDLFSSIRTRSIVHPSFQVTRPSSRVQLLGILNSELNDSYGYYNPRNELALSLGSCQESVSHRPNESELGLGISCAENINLLSDVRYQDSSDLHNSSVGSSICIPGMRIVLENEPNCPSIKDLSQYGCFGSQVLRRSKYLNVIQELLAEVTSYIQADEWICAFDRDLKNSSFSCSNEQGLAITCTNDIRSKNHEQEQSKQTTSEKSQLLSMLQLVDFQYNQCLEELQNVTSAFCNKTEYSIPQFCSYFSLHTVTLLHKNLRGRIISRLDTQLSNRCEKEQEDIESSFFHKQWALQQLRKAEDQSWRPQRGLPERSVSVLRAWMFQNFLHPYPKDDEKNLLAVKSGLTRSQVSNWFINARVRLWKPMIEELYSEIRKTN